MDMVRHPLFDILGVGQGLDSDVRAAAGVVVRGFDSVTGSWLHMHVYWFDDGGPDTAARFIGRIAELTDTPRHRDAVRQLEDKMIACGQLRLRTPIVDLPVQPTRLKLNGRDDVRAGKYARRRLSASAAAVYRLSEVEMHRKTTATDDCKWPENVTHVNRMSAGDLSGAEYIMWSESTSHVDADSSKRPQRPASMWAIPTSVASLASELRERLSTGEPILLPPKDYDTLSRSRGNLNGIEERRCVNARIVGAGGPRRSQSVASAPQTYL